MNTEAILFDMDGTVISSRKAAVNAAREGLRTYFNRRNEEPVLPSSDEIASLIGLPSIEYFRALLPESHKANAKQLKSIVQKIEIARIRKGFVEYYRNMNHVLSKFRDKGIKLGLVTNAGRSYFKANQKALSLDRYFHFMNCVEDTRSGEKTELVRKFLRSFDHPESVMVGDKVYDLEAAKAHDIPFVGCTWGYAVDGELDDADRIVESPEELPQTIRELRKRRS